MNSIETYSPPKLGTLDSDEKVLGAEALGGEAGALEALRALLGGQPQAQSFGFSPDEGGEDTGAELLAALGDLLEGGGVPDSLAALISGLQQSLKGSGDIQSNPDAAAQIKTLLQEMQTSAFAVTDSTRQDKVRDLLAAALRGLTADEKAVAGPADLASLTAELAGLPPEGATLGHAILQSLGSQSAAAAEAATATTGPATAERIEQVSALMTQMADRVLVTDPLHGQTPEVRIKLAENIMPGTEVRVWRDDGGQLKVQFDTVSPYWARVLNEASPLLSQRLNERLQAAEPPVVTVREQGGQPEDGRSRNRNNPWDLIAQSNEG